MATPEPKTPTPTKSQSSSVESVKAPAKPTASTPGPTVASTGPAKNNTLKIVLIVAAVLVGLSILGAVASAFFAKSFVESGISALTGGKAKVDTNKGSVTVKGEDGSAAFSTESKLPSGFPSDVPIYSPATVRFSISTAKDSYNVTWVTNDGADKVVSFYKSKLASGGWVLKENSSASFGVLTTSAYTKGDRELTLTVTGASGDTKTTAISVTVGPAAK